MLFINIFSIAASNRAFYSPKLIRRLLVNAFLAKNDITSLIVLLQQVCSGLSRLSLVTAPEVAKQSTDNFKASASEEQIIEMREFLSQILNDVVYNLKNSPGVVQVTQELLEVRFKLFILFYDNYFLFFFFFTYI